MDALCEIIIPNIKKDSKPKNNFIIKFYDGSAYNKQKTFLKFVGEEIFNTLDASNYIEPFQSTYNNQTIFLKNVGEKEMEVNKYNPRSIELGDRKIKLFKNIDCDVYIDDEYTVIRNKKLNIIVREETLEKAIEYFNEYFISMYDRFLNKDDSFFTEKALLIKKELIRLTTN